MARGCSWLALPVALLVCALAAEAAPAKRARHVALSGELQVRISDDFQGDRSTYSYRLKTRNGKLLRLRIRGASTSRLATAAHRGRRVQLESGARVRVRGTLRGRRLTVRSRNIRVSAAARASAASGPQKVAVIMFNFQNAATEPWTDEDVRDVVFTNPDSVNEYYQEQSTGDVSLTGKVRGDGDVYGWYTIPHDNSPCNFLTWMTAADAAATGAGVDLSGYDNFAYISPWSNCPFAGVAALNGNISYMNNALNLRVISHELGHNYGMHHASSYSCTGASGEPVQISDNCTSGEYGDPFDVMGGAATRHFHNWHKTQASFLSQANTQTISGSGTYTLSPSEQALPGQVQVLRILRSDGTYYYLDYRRPQGTYFDNFSAGDPAVNGVSIRIAPEYGTIVQSRLLDANPATSNFMDAPLPVGSTFTDSAADLAITTLAVSASGATVSVSVPQPPPSPPDSPDPPEEDDDSPVDGQAPVLRVKVARRQRALRRGKLHMRAKCDEACTVTASGRVTPRVRRSRAPIRRTKRRLSAGRTVRLRPKLSRRALRAVRRGLARGRRVTARVTVTARDTSGNSVAKKLRIRVRR